jgi:hypothetical protein
MSIKSCGELNGNRLHGLRRESSKSGTWISKDITEQVLVCK